MKLEQAQSIASKYLEQLKPFCDRAEIAGSIRRKKPDVKDIEIVAIRTPSKIQQLNDLVNRWKKVKGTVLGKYTQRVLPEGIKLDLFFADVDNWGLIYAIRTGSAEFSHKVLALGWHKKGYKSEGGILISNTGNHRVEIKEEKELFDFLGLDYIEPYQRI